MNTPKRWGPKWLRKLTRESWQAELVISGAAIIGSLQLPGLFEKFQHFLLLTFDREVLFYWYFANIYWAIFVFSLIALFVSHFITRALWIGLLGLKSRYPNGMARTTILSEDYQDKMAADYGDMDGYIQQLDRTASGMFGLGFMTAGQFFNFGLLLSGGVLLYALLRWMGLPDFWALLIISTPIVLLMVGSTLSGIMVGEKLRDRPWVKRYHYPLAKIISRLSNPVNFNYYAFGAALASTNHLVEKKVERVSVTSMLSGFVLMLLIGLGIGVLFGLSDTFKPPVFDTIYHRMGADSTGIDPANYAGGVTDELLYEPFISTLYSHPGEPFWAWVPLPERELTLLLDNCTSSPVNESLGFRERRRATKTRVLACASEYIDVYLDGDLLPFPEAMRQWWTSADMEQLGLHLELSHLNLPPGRHTLKIVTHYPLDPNKPNEDFRTTYIPFYVVDPGHTLSERNPAKRSESAPEY